jgi:uncharacterized membrane protein YhiD involved in acid resistance
MEKPILSEVKKGIGLILGVVLGLFLLVAGIILIIIFCSSLNNSVEQNRLRKEKELENSKAQITMMIHSQEMERIRIEAEIESAKMSNQLSIAKSKENQAEIESRKELARIELQKEIEDNKAQELRIRQLQEEENIVKIQHVVKKSTSVSSTSSITTSIPQKYYNYTTTSIPGLGGSTYNDGYRSGRVYIRGYNSW